MTYRGRVKNGVVVLEDPSALPEGTEVTVLPVEAEQPGDEADENEPTMYHWLERFIGAFEGLPPDFSINHDHYLYGTPKEE